MADPADTCIPLIVGVTGHRDLLADEIPAIRRVVEQFFDDLNERFPQLPIRVLTGLAVGADTLVAEVAAARGAQVTNLLPLPVPLYETDFSGPDLRRLHTLLEAAESVELPLLTGADDASVSQPGPQRDLQYEQLGVYLAAHSHILLALWDGKENHAMGGTGQVVAFHQHDTTILDTDAQARSQLDVADDESDLVYHVVCSRASSGAPEAGLQPGTASWFTRDYGEPRTAELPERYATVFEQMGRYNADLQLLAPDAVLYELTPQHLSAHAQTACGHIQSVFGSSDALANYFQGRTVAALRITLGSALAAGLAFIIYADFDDFGWMIWLYFLFVGVAVGSYALARRQQWQARYLDYRVLAESLRVQYYWVLGGVAMANPSRYSHDSFFHGRDLQLGWIRNVMRFTGLHATADVEASDEDLRLAIEHWVGGDGRGQLGYYQRRTGDKLRELGTTERLTLICFLVGLLAAGILALPPIPLDDLASNLLVALMGLLPLIAAARQNYAHRMAERELVAQYAHMLRIFDNAAQLIAAAPERAAKQQILLELGEAALHENAQWLLRQRERPLPGGEAVN